MPPRSSRPGLKRNPRGRPYWIARNVVRDPMGYPDSCIALPVDATNEQLAEMCQLHTSRLLSWIESCSAGENEPVPIYDGTVRSASRIYQSHPYSRFRTVKANTRKSYTDSLKVIENTVGARLIRRVTILDVQHWYDEWRKPALIKHSKDGNPVFGPERIDRAHDAVSMFKTVLRFNAALRRPDCKQLLEDLEKATSIVRFERGGAREVEMTSAHAGAFIKTALELGQRGVIPDWRARYMAIGIAAQYELGLRQRDIIGERPKNVADLEAAKRRGATAIVYGGVTWVGYFTWEGIPGWRWRMRTSKSKYRSPMDFDLSIYGLLHPLLHAVPFEERTGAVVKGEHGHAVQERSYRKWFREIARTAGIPDEIWNMDSRAGAATEAEEAQVPLELIGEALDHSKARTTPRYIRRRSTKIAEVGKARQAFRKAQEGGGSHGS
jgi:hypothetical protein